MRRWYANPVFWGSLASLIVVVAAVFLGFGETCAATGECQQRFSAFLSATPNEIGDTLAGFAGTLAFVWIIVTVLLQSRELAAQREELNLTRREFQKMAEAQAEQVSILKAQATIFEGEQKQRDETRAENLLNEKLQSLVLEISESSRRGLCWHFSDGEIDDNYGSNSEVISYCIGNSGDEELEVDDAIIALRRRLSGLHDTLWDLLHQSIDYRLPQKSGHISELLQSIASIVEMQEDLPLPQQERLFRLKLSEVASYLVGLNDTQEIWQENAS